MVAGLELGEALQPEATNRTRITKKQLACHVRGRHALAGMWGAVQGCGAESPVRGTDEVFEIKLKSTSTKHTWGSTKLKSTSTPSVLQVVGRCGVH